MEASNISIKKWILAIYLATSNKKGISSVQLGKHIGISQQSAWFMLYRIREAKGIKFKSSGMFSGTTEIDECYVGIRDNNHNLLHPFSFKGSMNKELFKEYLQEKLLPFPPKNSYLIMDNASFHKGKDIEKLFKIHEINLMYLPPYSPDLNPIEKKVTIHQTVSHHK